MKNALRRILNIGMFFWIIIMVLLFNACMLSLIYNVLADPNKDTHQLTNIGFLIFIAVANICFTWGRTYENKDVKVLKQLNDTGRYGILAAISFMLGSFFKYMHTAKLLETGNPRSFLHIEDLLYPSFFICFLISGLVTMYIITDLLLLIASHHIWIRPLTNKERTHITDLVDQSLSNTYFHGLL